MSTEIATPPPSQVKLPSYPWRFAHLAALWAFGVSQPVFSMLKGNPEFLVVRGSTRDDVVVFAVVVAFLVPLLVVLVELAASVVSAMLSRALHIVAVWGFSFLAALQLLRLLDPERGVALLLPMVPAVIAAFVYMNSNTFRSILSISVALPVVGSLFFVATVPLAVDDRAGADVAVKGNTPVVMVLLDELPTSSLLRADGTLDEVRYPNFARLASDGVWYRNATTVHEFTTQAVPSVLTGKLPGKGELPTLSDHPENLFTLLGERYAIEATEPVTRLCPSRYCPETHVQAPRVDRYRGLLYDSGIGFLYRVLPRSMRLNLPPIGDRWGGFGEDPESVARERLLGALDQEDVKLALEQEEHQPRTDFERFVGSIERGEPARTLHLLHVKLPHAPWRLLPSGRQYGNAASTDGILGDAFNYWADEAWLVEQALQRHLLQVGYTDRVLGVLMRRLRDAGIYERALVVVTADHGASFEAGGSKRYVDRANIPNIAAVPLFVKYPGVQGGRVDLAPARTIDVVPTIADVLGVDIPWRVDGRSLRGKLVAGRVSIGRRAGGAVTATHAEVEAGVRATARRNTAVFGEGRDSMYRIGPHHEVHSKPTTAFARDRAKTAKVRLDGETLYANVDLGSAFVPARVVGDIEGRLLAVGTPLAVSVNGRIVATTRTYNLDGRSRFAVLVPERSFKNGRNAVEVFVIEEGGTIRLVSLGGTGRDANYVLAGDARSIVLPSGRRALVTADRLKGRIETSTSDGGTVRIRGWAADVDRASRVDRILVFAGRRLVFASDTSVYRWTIPGVSGRPGLERVGFVAELPVDEAETSSLRAFAVRGNVATELEWPGRAARVVAAARTP